VCYNFCIEENEYDDDDDNKKMADESRDPNRFVCVGSSRPDAEAKRNANCSANILNNVYLVYSLFSS